MLKAFRVACRVVLLSGVWIGPPVVPAAAQTAPPRATPPAAPGSRRLTDGDARRVTEWGEAIIADLAADRWDLAIARARDIVALRTRIQGASHFETVNVEWNLKALLRVAAMRREDRDAFQRATTLNREAKALRPRGKFAQGQALLEESLEIRRRLLTDEHPDTAISYNDLATLMEDQGKWAEARPLYEKALEICRRAFTDDHPTTAAVYSNLASNLATQGKYARAQALYEKALEIYRRVLGDDEEDTASAYNNLAVNLERQGEYARARPLLEKALSIYRHQLTDDHIHTAAAYSNLAFCLQHQGEYARARALYERTLEIKRGLLAEAHPSIAQACNNLAWILQAQGDLAGAGALLEKALDIHRRSSAVENTGTARSYHLLAVNLGAQARHAQAQPLFERVLDLRQRLLTDEHPDTARSYHFLAANLQAQGQYVRAQALFEKALALRQGLLGDDHRETARSYHFLAANLDAQGKYLEAERRWLGAVKSLDAARLRVAFTGMERAEAREPVHIALAALLARLGRPAEAWQSLEEDLGRGLLDELAARDDRARSPADRDRLHALTADLERLDKLMETRPKDLDQAGRAARFEGLMRRRELASIALGEFQARLVQDHGPLAGRVAERNEIQAALPADAALIAWVDLAPAGPNAADPDGEHWGVVVRPRGEPAWVPIAGNGPGGLWTEEDTGLPGRVRAALRRRPGIGTGDARPPVERLRAQRLEPLAKALGITAENPTPARRLIVLPSRAMAGIPVEALLAPDDTRIVSYAPSATVFKYLRERRRPDRHAGLLALGDPVYERHDESDEPGPRPDHGLLVQRVAPGSNAASHGLKSGDVLLAYQGRALKTSDDLKVVAAGDRPIGVDIWRDGRASRGELAPGDLGVVLDPRPAPEAIAAKRAMDRWLSSDRSGDRDFKQLPGTRREVEAIARLFESDGRSARVLLGADACEPELDHLAASGALGRFGFIHLATHGVIDEALPARSAVILTQAGLPDPLEQVLHQQPAYDGRLSVREIRRGWELRAELVTLSACETALGREAGGEGLVGFTQALLMSGTRSVCLSLWKVDDTATALLMQRFYADLLGRRPGLAAPLPKAEALREAQAWLRGLGRAEALDLMARLSGGVARGKDAPGREAGEPAASVPAGGADDRPYASPHFWAAFVLAGDPD
jgi:tetratricopeptide (TPR) repeat protein